MDRDTLLRRAAKLAALANKNPNAAEAESAAEALGRLLAEHRLTMQEVNAAAIARGIREEVAHTGWKVAPEWSMWLAAAIASALDCRSLTASVGQGTDKEHAAYVFVGEDADAAVAGYWFGVLVKRLPDMATRHRRTVEREHRFHCALSEAQGRVVVRRSWIELRQHFLMGVAMRCNERLAAMLKPAAGPAGESARALVLMKGTAVERYMEHMHPAVMEADKEEKAGPVSFDGVALRTGYEAGDQVAMSHGIASADRAALPGTKPLAPHP